MSRNLFLLAQYMNLRKKAIFFSGFFFMYYVDILKRVKMFSLTVNLMYKIILYKIILIVKQYFFAHRNFNAITNSNFPIVSDLFIQIRL